MCNLNPSWGPLLLVISAGISGAYTVPRPLELGVPGPSPPSTLSVPETAPPCPGRMAPQAQPLCVLLATCHSLLPLYPASQHLCRGAWEPVLTSLSQEAELTTPLCHLHLRLLLAEQRMVLIWGNCFFPSLFLQDSLFSFLIKSSSAKDLVRLLFPKLEGKVFASCPATNLL